MAWPEDPGEQPAHPQGPKQGRLATVHLIDRTTVIIGRGAGCDVVLDDLLVSLKHAELRKVGESWVLTDRSSFVGTYVNGRRVSKIVAIDERDVIGIGRHLLQLRGNRLFDSVDTGDNTFEASQVAVTTNSGARLLHDVSFSLGGKMMLGVVGPSGSGKSTLLNALAGSLPVAGGTVRYAGRDLISDYEELSHRVALVPQEDILHTQLTVSDALTYAAQLRFAADTTDEERKARVKEVLEELGLTAHAHKRIDQLSGGQRKRTSVALELLTKPSLLMLDEPTSGLDPGMDRSLTRKLRELADDSRTVVVVTHNVANLELCDRILVLANDGHLAYFGTAKDALAYFGEQDFADIFLKLETAPGEKWARRFRASSHHHRYLASAENLAPVARARVPTLPYSERAQRRNRSLQLRVLVRRRLAVIGSDRQYLLLLATSPLILSMFARAIPGSSGLSMERAVAAVPLDQRPVQLLLVLVVSAALMGTTAAIQELVRERAIYKRERAAGLSVTAYLASKTLVLGTIVTLQCAAFAAISLVGRHPPDDPLVLSSGRLEVFIAILAAGLVTMLLALLVSAVIANLDQSMPFLVLIVMAQLVFSGGLFPVDGRIGLEQVAWLTPSRWAYSMSAATTDLSRVLPQDRDATWDHAAGTWVSEGALVLGMALALVLLTAAVMVRAEPRGRRVSFMARIRGFPFTGKVRAKLTD